MTLNDLIGTFAAVLTTGAFVPQVLQSYRTRDVSGISLGMYLLFTTGVGAWLVYGLLERAWPLVAANGVTLGLALCILRLKLVERWRPGAWAGGAASRPGSVRAP
jgi:MtN3 and saliva related transmembrane protein